MIRLIVKISLFKRGLFWYACCEMPTEESEVFYFDDEPYTTIKAIETLYCVGLTRKRASRKMINKLKQYFKERNDFYD